MVENENTGNWCKHAVIRSRRLWHNAYTQIQAEYRNIEAWVRGRRA